MDNSQIIQNNIEAAMSRAGESRNSLSEKTGIPYTTLSRRLTVKGKGIEFTLGNIAALADALNVSPDELVSPLMFSNKDAA